MPTRRGFLLVGSFLHAGISDAAHRCLECGILGSSIPRRLAAGSPALSPIERGFSRGTPVAATASITKRATGINACTDGSRPR